MLRVALFRSRALTAGPVQARSNAQWLAPRRVAAGIAQVRAGDVPAEAMNELLTQ
jgi:hypothetical protein